MENSAKETFSNFLKQQLVNLLFLITYFINKLTEWQWVLLWVPPLQMHFYAIMKKNGWIIAQIYKRYLDDAFVLFSFKEHLQLFVDYMKKKHKCRKLTSEAENDKSFLFLDIKITVITNNFKHLFLKKQLLVVYLHSMKVTCIKHKKSP